MTDLYTPSAYTKLENPPHLMIQEVVCCWSDLLGFGNTISEENWSLPEKTAEKVYSRLTKAQKCLASNLDPTSEVGLTLNDGFARSSITERFTDPVQPSMWFRGCLFSHQCLNEKDSENGFPGARTVISHGKSLKHSCEELRFDDFVFPYTKKNPQSLSSIAKRNGNPQIYINPINFQMNTAFSKAYIIDEAGSEAGISGPNFFIDNSFILFLKEFYRKYISVEDVVESLQGDIYKIAFKSSDKRYYS